MRGNIFYHIIFEIFIALPKELLWIFQVQDYMCGTQDEKLTFPIWGISAYIEFVTDESKSGRGFKMTYNMIYNPGMFLSINKITKNTFTEAKIKDTTGFWYFLKTWTTFLTSWCFYFGESHFEITKFKFLKCLHWVWNMAS